MAALCADQRAGAGDLTAVVGVGFLWRRLKLLQFETGAIDLIR
jgi:hypothetical protein